MNRKRYSPFAGENLIFTNDVSWVQNVVRQFGPYLPLPIGGNDKISI